MPNTAIVPAGSGERDYLDPLGAQPAGGGVFRAARMDRDEAYAKYGRA